MHEIELKFQVPAARRTALAAAQSTRAAPARIRLEAIYFDTAERALARAGLGLRLRREGTRWVQTLKGPAVGGMARLEHNVARDEAATPPVVEPALHAGTPAGDALLACLAATGAAPLVPRYRTEIDRVTRELRVRTPPGRVELALDTGCIVAGGQAVEVSEFEIELLAGSPLAVIATARRWVPRFGLWLDSRSKAERGDLLARGEAMAAPRPAGPVALRREMREGPAWQAVLQSCAEQVIVNASQIASGVHGAEHVHQLRIGLRRLRSALRLFGNTPAAPELAEGAAALFKGLGGARDRAVAEAEFGARLAAAMRVAGLVAGSPWPGEGPAADSPVDAVRAAASQGFLLDLLAAMHGPGADGVAAAADDLPLRDRLAQRLNRWHRQVAADAKRFADLDDAGRHRLRKRAKRLRYAAEFSASLFGQRRVRRYLKALRRLQDRLGATTDVAMAMALLDPAAEPPDRAPALFALGWLAAERERLVAASAPALTAFAGAERFWKRGKQRAKRG